MGLPSPGFAPAAFLTRPLACIVSVLDHDPEGLRLVRRAETPPGGGNLLPGRHPEPEVLEHGGEEEEEFHPGKTFPQAVPPP